MSDRSRKRLRTITIVLATALVIAPAAALAGHQFTDVPDSNVFHDDIEWMRDNGVTAGCNPPANDEYCPGDNVTREQMAAFMHRLETENVFVRPGADAVDGGNADTVDGKHAADFLGATDKAVDADKLDGKDSSAFVASSNLLWALVDDAGALVDGSGATAATRLSEGRFRVTFNRAIDACIVLGTAVDVTGGVVPSAVSTRIVATDNRVQADDTTVDVSTTNPSGTAEDPQAGDGFAITVHC